MDTVQEMVPEEEGGGMRKRGMAAVFAAATLASLLAGCSSDGADQSAPEFVLQTPSNVKAGSVQTAQIPSVKSDIGTNPANIWFPPQYFREPNRKFPVVYMYHGIPGWYSNWTDLFGASAAALKQANAGYPIVWVFPTVSPTNNDGLDTECVNGAAGDWYTYLSSDVPDWINSHLRTLPDAKHNANGGLSMGGTCAQTIALRTPSRFSVFGNISGTTSPQFGDGVQQLYGDNYSQSTVDANTSKWILTNQPASRSVINWLAIGTKDQPVDIAEQNSYATYARSLGVKVTQVKLVGGHGKPTWIRGINAYAPFVAPLVSGK